MSHVAIKFKTCLMFHFGRLPHQVLTHAVRAAAEQAPLVAGPRAAAAARAKGSVQSNFDRSRFGPSRNRGMSHESKRPWKAVLRASDQATLTRALCA